MHHNYEKNTLHIDLPLTGGIAKAANVPPERAVEVIKSAKAKMYAARKLRPTPCIDKTVYTSWNAMMISAYLEAGRVLDDAEATRFALRTLDRVLAQKTNTEGSEVAQRNAELGHVVAYDDGVVGGEPVAGGLEDYVFTGHAALDAWEATGEMRYFEAALARLVIQLWRSSTTTRRVGSSIRNAAADGVIRFACIATAAGSRCSDSPSPGGNSVAAALLVRLAELLPATMTCVQRRCGDAGVLCGVGGAPGLQCASYGLALRRLSLGPVQTSRGSGRTSLRMRWNRLRCGAMR